MFVCLFVFVVVVFFNFFFKFLFLIIKFLSTSRGSLFSNLLLCRIVDIAYYIAMVLMSMKVCLIFFVGILSFSSKIFIEGVCVVALAPAVNIGIA